MRDQEITVTEEEIKTKEEINFKSIILKIGSEIEIEEGSEIKTLHKGIAVINMRDIIIEKTIILQIEQMLTETIKT